MNPQLPDQLLDELRRFISSFAVRDARRRLLSLFETKRGQQKIVMELDHVPWLDRRFALLVPRELQTSDHIGPMLRERGSPEKCRIISTDGSLNNREMSLDAALQLIVGCGHGTLVFCLPGQLAYYESEEPKERYVCYRKGPE